MTDKNTAALTEAISAAIGDYITPGASWDRLPHELAERRITIIAAHLPDHMAVRDMFGNSASGAFEAACLGIPHPTVADVEMAPIFWDMPDPQPSGDDAGLVSRLKNEGARNGEFDGSYAWNARELCAKASTRITDLSATVARQARELLTAHQQAQDAMDRVAQLEAIAGKLAGALPSVGAKVIYGAHGIELRATVTGYTEGWVNIELSDGSVAISRPSHLFAHQALTEWKGMNDGK